MTLALHFGGIGAKVDSRGCDSVLGEQCLESCFSKRDFAPRIHFFTSGVVFVIASGFIRVANKSSRSFFSKKLTRKLPTQS